MTSDGVINIPKVTDTQGEPYLHVSHEPYTGILDAAYHSMIDQLMRPSPIMDLWRADAERARAEFNARPWVVRRWITGRRAVREWWAEVRYRVARSIYAFDEGDGY